MRPRSILLLCAAVLFACQPTAKHPAAREDVAGLRQQVGYDGFGRTAPATLNGVTVMEVAALPPIAPPDRAVGMVIRTASASIEVDSLEPAVAQVQQLAARVGGYVANTVSLHELVPVVGSAGISVMGEAVRQAWRNFMALTALTVQLLGVLIPLGVLAVIAWVATRRWRPAKQTAA